MVVNDEQDKLVYHLYDTSTLVYMVVPFSANVSVFGTGTGTLIVS